MTTKRLDIEPTDDTLVASIAGNQTGRNGDIVDFINMLAQTEGPYTYMIDAAWGDGKTFFLKSVELVLKAANPKQKVKAVGANELNLMLPGLSDDACSILPYYFNAWQNDFAEDPITALFACMAAEFGRTDMLKETAFYKALTGIVDVALAFTPFSIRTSEIANSLSSESLVESYEKRLKIRDSIKALGEEVVKQGANKLVIFIDELDRCRPDFAVRLLEQTKNLFASENIILVFATDSVQLAHAVGGAYGAGFDTSKFLERFFDERLTLSHVDSLAFVHGEGAYGTGNRFDMLVKEILYSEQRSIRDQQRLKDKLLKARTYCTCSTFEDLPHQLAACAVLPLLVFIENEDPRRFRSITAGSDFDALYESGKDYKSFNENIVNAIELGIFAYAESPMASSTADDCRRCMHCLCAYIYGRKTFPFEWEDAHKLFGYCSAVFDSEVYRCLKFPDEHD